MSAFNRLHELRMENDDHRYFMQDNQERFDKLASRHEDETAPKAISAFNLFQTPQPLAERMAGMIPKNCDVVLEPSAGLGRIYKELEKRNPHTHKILVEQSKDCSAELYKMTEGKNASLAVGDFLEIEPRCVDAVVMNPPFKMRRDIKHIMKALEWVKSGGVLVALCLAGKIREDKLKHLCEHWETVPAGTFKSEGTNVETVLLRIKKH